MTNEMTKTTRVEIARAAWDEARAERDRVRAACIVPMEAAQKSLNEARAERDRVKAACIVAMEAAQKKMNETD